MGANLSGVSTRVMTVLRAEQDVASHAQRRRYPMLQDQQAWIQERDKVLVCRFPTSYGGSPKARHIYAVAHNLHNTGLLPVS